MRPGRSWTSLDREEDAGHVAGAVVGVVADGEALAGGAEQHLLVGEQAVQAHRVDRDAARALAAAGTLDDVARGGVVGPLARRRGHALGRAHRGAGRRVDLAVVVELDDLGRLEPRRRQLGEAHHEHGADGEVGGDEAGALGELAPRCAARSASVKPVVPTTAWRPCSAAKARLLARGVGDGEVDDHLGAGLHQRLGGGRHLEVRVDVGDPAQVDAGVQRVDRGDELEVGVGLDGLAHGAAHAPCRAEDPDP